MICAPKQELGAPGEGARVEGIAKKGKSGLIIPRRINLLTLTTPQQLTKNIVVHREEFAIAFVEGFGVLDEVA